MERGQPLRTAVVGFGVSGRVFHAPLIAADPKYSLDVIVTGNPDRAAQAGALYPGVKVLARPEEVFDHADELDLVVLGTPPVNHFKLAEKAIACGLNVVVDKPFVPTSAEGEELITRAADAGVVLSVFQNRRWDGDFLTVKKLIDDGLLGEVRTFESRFEWWMPEGFRSWKDEARLSEGGGILFDLGSHLIDQAVVVFGPVKDLYAETVRHSNGGSNGDEDTFVSLLHRSGVRSRLWMNGLAALPAPRFHLLGSTAAFTKWGLDGQEPALAAGVLPTDASYGTEPESTWGVLGAGAEEQQFIPTERGSYPEYYRLLASAIHDGGKLPVDPSESVAVLRIIEEIHGLR